MSLVIKTDEKGIKIYRKDKVSQAGNPYQKYSIKVNSKDADGNWQSAFIDCAFKKGVEVNNKATIKINNAFYTVNSYQDKTSLRLMILDFDVIEHGEAQGKPQNVDSSFVDVPDDIESELPFK